MKYLAVELSTVLYFVVFPPVFPIDSATVDKLTSRPSREFDEKQCALG